MRTQIFAPLGMTMASFRPLGLEQAPDRAQPYRHDGVLGQMPIPWNRLQYLEPLGRRVASMQASMRRRATHCCNSATEQCSGAGYSRHK